MTQWWLVAAMGLAGFVQSTIGFGFGIVTMGLVGWLVGVRETAVLSAGAALSLNLFVLWRLRAHFRWERTVPIFATVLVGAPFGVLFLAHAEPRLLHLLLGLLLVASAVQSRIERLAAWRWHPVWLGGPCGLLSGALSGAFGTGGPPLVVFVSSQRYDRLRYVATVQLLLAASNVVRCEELLRRGLLSWSLLPGSGLGVIGALAGALLGLRLLRRLPDRVLRIVVALFLLLMGIRYLALCA